MHYTLAHGTANDFVVLPDLDDAVELTAGLAEALAERRRGLGADGVIRIGAPPPEQRDAQVFMDHRNADGSHAEMCGNGVRVVAKHVVDHGLVSPDPDAVVRVATRAGTKAVRVAERDGAGRVTAVTVDMGPPELDPARVPFVADDALAVRHPVELHGEAAATAGSDHLDVAVVSMGNPHAVVSIATVDTAPVGVLGPAIEAHPRFPNGVNVGFVEVVDDGHVNLRVFERGVGETAACGTGACAAVVALQRDGQVADRVAVALPGGTLTIEHRPGGSVMMTGPAIEVAHGELDPAWLASALPAPSPAAN